MRDAYIKKFSAALRELRAATKLTQSSLALKLGLDSSTVSRYEKGELVPSETVVRLMLFQFSLLGCAHLGVCKDLAVCYDLNLDDFTSGTTTEPPAIKASEHSQPSWIDAVSESEATTLRDFWLARRLADPELVDEIDSHIRSIKRISKKRGLWIDEKGQKTA